MPLSISRCSQIVAAPPDVLNKMVAGLKYKPWLIFEYHMCTWTNLVTISEVYAIGTHIVK